MKNWIKENPVLLISIGLVLFTLGAVLAPIFAYLGLEPIADILYAFYVPFCHQRPWRSYHLFDYQFAMDARMTFMFLSMSVAGFIVHFKKVKPLSEKLSILFGIAMIAPLGLDGTIQAIAEITSYSDLSIPFWESTNLIRSTVGSIFGVGIGFALLPHIIGGAGIANYRKFFTLSFVALIISLIFIPIIVFVWSITSSKYTPSSMFIDNAQRFPGYNYEITTSAGHSTIERKILGANDLDYYIERAEKYDKQELIDEFHNK